MLLGRDFCQEGARAEKALVLVAEGQMSLRLRASREFCSAGGHCRSGLPPRPKGTRTNDKVPSTP